MLKDGILVLAGVLSPQDCALWRATYDEYERIGSQTDYSGNKVVHARDITNAVRRRMFHDTVRMVPKLIQEWYKETHFVESPFLAKQPPKSIIEPHYDNVKIDGVTRNHTPQRSHSALIYLSEDFEGGEITFPRQKQAIKPRIGMMVAFPAGAPYLHYVRPISGGPRYTMPVWMTQLPSNFHNLES